VIGYHPTRIALQSDAGALHFPFWIFLNIYTTIDLLIMILNTFADDCRQVYFIKQLSIYIKTGDIAKGSFKKNL